MLCFFALQLRLFNFLWRLKRVETALNRTWAQNHILGERPNTPQSSPAIILRNYAPATTVNLTDSSQSLCFLPFAE